MTGRQHEPYVMNLISSHKNTRYGLFLSYAKEAFIAFVVIFLPIFFPETAHASLLSFLSSFVGQTVSADQTVATTTQYNSLTIPLGVPPVNSIIDMSPANDETLAIADNALMPSVGPSGSAADIDSQPESTAISTYVVRPGDTLSEIALLFDVSVNTIVWANDLGTHPVIQPGETLVILPVSGINYAIKKGDTLASIIKRYGGDQNEILEYNGLSSAGDLVVGDSILIPDGELGGASIGSGVQSNPHTGLVSGEIYEPYLGGGGPAASGPYVGGYYACPVHGSWLSQGLHGHNAVDLALGIGNPIYASADGVVIIAKTGGWNGGYGSYVVISHQNGTETLYAHAEEIFVSAGEHVDEGDEIAKIGVTGETTGPHLHFEVRGAANPFLTVKC